MLIRYANILQVAQRTKIEIVPPTNTSLTEIAALDLGEFKLHANGEEIIHYIPTRRWYYFDSYILLPPYDEDVTYELEIFPKQFGSRDFRQTILCFQHKDEYAQIARDLRQKDIYIPFQNTDTIEYITTKPLYLASLKIAYELTQAVQLYIANELIANFTRELLYYTTEITVPTKINVPENTKILVKLSRQDNGYVILRTGYQITPPLRGVTYDVVYSRDEDNKRSMAYIYWDGLTATIHDPTKTPATRPAMLVTPIESQAEPVPEPTQDVPEWPTEPNPLPPLEIPENLLEAPSAVSPIQPQAPTQIAEDFPNEAATAYPKPTLPTEPKLTIPDLIPTLPQTVTDKYTSTHQIVETKLTAPDEQKVVQILHSPFGALRQTADAYARARTTDANITYDVKEIILTDTTPQTITTTMPVTQVIASADKTTKLRFLPVFDYLTGKTINDMPYITLQANEKLTLKIEALQIEVQSDEASYQSPVTVQLILLI